MTVPAVIIVAGLATLAFTDLAPPLAPLAAFALAGVALGYVVGCWLYPLRTCPACAGKSVQYARGPFGGFRPCPACAGTGARLRRGVRLWQWLRRRTHRGR